MNIRLRPHVRSALIVGAVGLSILALTFVVAAVTGTAPHLVLMFFGVVPTLLCPLLLVMASSRLDEQH